MNNLQDNDIMVTIRCLTYNHEPYIRECLEGFVMQRTNFKFEAIVHDDASTDGTAGIVREYAEKFPDIIKPIYQTENQYSKRDGSICRIMNEHTRGKYIAMCEGDDYWIDPLKLQKQVDFLEANEEYSMCFHSARIECADERNGERFKILENIDEREYTPNDLIRHYYSQTATMVFRAEVLLTMPTHKNFIVGDVVLITNCCRIGRVLGFNKQMSVYRIHNGGVSVELNPEGRRKFFIGLNECFGEFSELIEPVVIAHSVSSIKHSLKEGQILKMYSVYLDSSKCVGGFKILKALMNNLLKKK